MPDSQSTTTALPQRQLGNQGLTVSALGLGCMGMSEFYGPSSEQDSIKTLHEAVALGINWLDTADMYGTGANEELIRKALATMSDKPQIATKFGIVRDGDPTARMINGQPEYVKKACDASLQRLGIDTIDLYYAHRIDSTIPIEETVGAMADLVQAGKIRYIGLSEATTDTLKRASTVHPISALQTEYSLWSREPEQEILSLCESLNIGFVAYSPLGRGFLAGAIKDRQVLSQGDWRLANERFSEENLKKNTNFLNALEKLAQELDCTPAQLALAWLLAQGQQITAIPGTRSINRLKENIAATQIELSAEVLKHIEETLSPFSISGDRYDANSLAIVASDTPALA